MYLRPESVYLNLLRGWNHVKLVFCTKLSKCCHSKVLLSFIYICRRTERPAQVHLHASTEQTICCSCKPHVSYRSANSRHGTHSSRGGGRLLQGPQPVSTIVDEPASRGVFLLQRFHFYQLVADEHLMLSALLWSSPSRHCKWGRRDKIGSTG